MPIYSSSLYERSRQTEALPEIPGLRIYVLELGLHYVRQGLERLVLISNVERIEEVLNPMAETLITTRN